MQYLQESQPELQVRFCVSEEFIVAAQRVSRITPIEADILFNLAMLVGERKGRVTMVELDEITAMEEGSMPYNISQQQEVSFMRAALLFYRKRSLVLGVLPSIISAILLGGYLFSNKPRLDNKFVAAIYYPASVFPTISFSLCYMSSRLLPRSLLTDVHSTMPFLKTCIASVSAS